jgi:hypothetical protein
MIWFAALVTGLATVAQAATVARILGSTIDEKDLGQEGVSGLLQQVMQRFAKHYLKANRLEATEDELSAMRGKLGGAAGKSPRVDPFMERYFVVGTVENFKMHRALWNKHGGRLVLSAFTVVYAAPDALAKELRALEERGRFAIPDARRREEFYRYLLDMKGDGLLEGQRAREVLANPPWK